MTELDDNTDSLWGKVILLFPAIRGNIEGLYHAKISGWSRPYSYQEASTDDLFDIYVRANTSEKNKHKIKSKPRPYDKSKKSKQEGRRGIKVPLDKAKEFLKKINGEAR